MMCLQCAAPAVSRRVPVEDFVKLKCYVKIKKASPENKMCRVEADLRTVFCSWLRGDSVACAHGQQHLLWQWGSLSILIAIP